MSTSLYNSKGKKKLDREYLTSKRNIVTAELYDDLQDKIDQVKKVVRNRSKIDIALVLRSCEQADNAVDAAIAKLTGQDGGQECLKEWAVQSKNNKLKYKRDLKTPKAITKQNNNRQNNTKQQQIDGDSETKNDIGSIPDHLEEQQTDEVTTNDVINEDGSNGDDGGEVRKSRSIKRQSRRFKKKPRPPKRIRDKLKRLVPLEKQIESLFEDNSQDSGDLETNTDPMVEIAAVRPGHIDSASTSGIESCTSSISGTGSTSPTDNSPVRPPSTITDVFSVTATAVPIQLPIPPIVPPSSSESEPSLKKLLKDLHRCDVSLLRYQSSLNEQCDIAIQNLRKVFAIIRIGLSTREEDIYNELQSIRQTASQTLHRRKITCVSLKRLSEFANHLDESQVQELKRQLKQFITERRIDEDLGLMRRFSADPDDLLPSIMKFGNTVDATVCYKNWNEFPGEAIGRSTTSSKGLLMTPPRMPPLIKTVPPIFFQCPQPSHIPFIPGVSIPYPIPSHAILQTQSVFSNVPILTNPPLPRPQTLLPRISSSTPRQQSLPTPKPLQTPIPTPILNKPHLPTKETVIKKPDNECDQLEPNPSTHLIKMQERVKVSLQAQGVYLYDPVTGKAMKSESPSTDTTIVKKTPTQQRRERKKRQKERERREREDQQNEEQDNSNKEMAAAKTDINDKVGKPATVSSMKGDRPWWSRRYHGQQPYKYSAHSKRNIISNRTIGQETR